MNLNFIIKKGHIFKRRYRSLFTFNGNYVKSNGLYLYNAKRFELVYLKVVKKLFRKKKLKKKLNYVRSRFWLMIRPNFLLTMKSKNSRMGSGVGSYVRVVCMVSAAKPIMFISRYSEIFIDRVIMYLRLKWGIKLFKISDKYW